MRQHMLALLRILLSFHFDIPHTILKYVTCEVYPHVSLTLAIRKR